ncbi:MAG: hypothetical protein K8F60_14010 [Melioribacteraceae bacterium]|nr:hypothetical protein [Melioribacteraceae bacterium]
MEKISYPAEIQKFFNEVIPKIKAVLNPEYILIAGSFGKGSWIYADGELLSDFEFVFICKSRWSVKKKKLLLKQLNSAYPYEISLKGYLEKNIKKKILSNYSFRNPGYIDLPFFDTFSEPRVLYSKNDNEFIPPKIGVNEIPIWEAWRLMVNRIGELLKLFANYEKFHNTDYENYFWLKTFESCADAFLLINKKYKTNIDERFQQIDNISNSYKNEADQSWIKYFFLLKDALRARQNHNLSSFNISVLSSEERMMNLFEWLCYSERKMFESENITSLNQYLHSSDLQRKYLEVSGKKSIVISNLIRIVANRSLLLVKPLKLTNYKYSWRHIILLSLESAFMEYKEGRLHFEGSKEIMNKIFYTTAYEELTGEEFLFFVLNYWTLLR